MSHRQQVCRNLAEKLRAAASGFAGSHAVIGMDGFVDSIIDVVDKRQNFEAYRRIETISAFGQKVLQAAGRSANYEFVVKQRKLGGNGPIMANALATAGVCVDYIGALGLPDPDPVFDELAGRACLHSLGEPGYTDALEFADGKLMLGKITQLHQINWANLMQRIGSERLTALIEVADLLAMNNWTMLPNLGDIWRHVLEEIMPRLSKRRRRVFIDLADPEKRTADDLRRDLRILSGMQQYAAVTLGLNLKEAIQIAEVVGVSVPSDDNLQIVQSAEAIRRQLEIDCVLIHPRRGAGAADASGQGVWFDGPLVRQPRLSTGAGDTFNAGVCLGQLAGCTLEESLGCGCAASGYYVRNAAAPTAGQLADFAEQLPVPEDQPLAVSAS